MTVISVPFRFRVAAGTLFFSLPLIALEVFLVNRSPWWNPPLRKLAYWCFAYTLLCIPLVIWLVHAKRWAFIVTRLFMCVWLAASGVIAIRMRYPALGFYTLILLLFCVGEWLWLKYELTRSYIDPQLAWYQGLPKPIPGLLCYLKYEKKGFPLRVNRMDTCGAFVFSQEELALPAVLRKKRLELDFQFREHRLLCDGRVVVVMGSLTQPMIEGVKGKYFGAGLQFLLDSPDLKKEVSDFIEVLSGEGYV